jgi:hypothetical protein
MILVLLFCFFGFVIFSVVFTYFPQLMLAFNLVLTSFKVMRPQHGVEFSLKELNSTSWNVGETPQVFKVQYGNYLLHVALIFFCFMAMYTLYKILCCLE